MIKNQLQKLKLYILEKERLEKELQHLDTLYNYGYQSPSFEPSFSKSVSSDEKMVKIIDKNSKIASLIEKRKNKLDILIIKLFKIIDHIDDPLVRNIVELKCINGLTYQEIGEQINYSKSQIHKIFKKFVES